MEQAARKVWTEAEFFAWQETQEDRFELVDGQPLRMMAGASNVHNRISGNIYGQMYVRLRDSPCQPFNGDGSVRTRPGQIRRPDIGVECGPFVPAGYTAGEPRVIFEVLSPTTRDVDTIRKLDEYQSIPSLRRIPLVEANNPEVAMWTRDETGAWIRSDVAGIDMPEIGVALPMAEIYRTIAFPLDLRLVAGT